MSVNLSDYENYAEILKQLGHPQRLCIVHNLMSGGCNVTKMQKCLGVAQTNVSQHLAKLKAAGIITGKRKGNEIYYEVTSDISKKIINTIYG